LCEQLKEKKEEEKKALRSPHGSCRAADLSRRVVKEAYMHQPWLKRDSSWGENSWRMPHENSYKEERQKERKKEVDTRIKCARRAWSAARRR
jgi:hypothetical protein